MADQTPPLTVWVGIIEYAHPSDGSAAQVFGVYRTPAAAHAAAARAAVTHTTEYHLSVWARDPTTGADDTSGDYEHADWDVDIRVEERTVED